MRKVVRTLLMSIGVRDDLRSAGRAIRSRTHPHHGARCRHPRLGNAGARRRRLSCAWCARRTRSPIPTCRSSCSPATASVRAWSRRSRSASTNSCSSRSRRRRCRTASSSVLTKPRPVVTERRLLRAGAAQDGAPASTPTTTTIGQVVLLTTGPLAGQLRLAGACPAQPGTNLADRSHRHRSGHDLDARHRLRCGAQAARQRAAGTAADLSGARPGRARSGGNLGGDGRDRARGHGQSRPDRQRRRRHRHHQPARNHGHLGPRHRQADPQRHRLAGPAHRRRLATRLRARRPRAATSPPRPACCSIPISPPARSPGCSTTSTARARRREAGRLAFGTIDSFLLWRLTGGKRSCDRRHQCRAHAAARHRQRPMGRGSVPAVRRADVAAAAGARLRRRFRHHRAGPVRRRRSASSAWPATSRRRPSGRAASRPA